MSDVFDLSDTPVHLGLGATVVPLSGSPWGPEFFEGYAKATDADGDEGRLVSMHTFIEPWEEWEMHPVGGELVFCIDGTMTLHQEVDGEVVTSVVTAGQAVVNDPGVWHTADIDGRATALFVTAGRGTEHRKR
jgi:quercetin dioxygenase-like cupin family protein